MPVPLLLSSIKHEVYECSFVTAYSASLNERCTFSGNGSFCKGVVMQQTSQRGTYFLHGTRKFCQRESKFDNVFFLWLFI